jgi:hypothetical protein|tara:strand:- start:1917 stop:2471 length:555 start_codon:yes stop_codon:yes gene_type:complete
MIFKDKKGQGTSGLVEFMITCFMIIVTIGFFVYAFNLITTSISIDQLAGQVNLSSATADTLGQINTAILDKINLIGVMILFGLVLAMMINAYFTRETVPKLFIVVDILLIILTYILSTYIANTYETIIALEPFSSFFLQNLEDPSRFLLNLPEMVVVVGVLIMIITYIGLPRTLREEVFIGRQR